MNAFYQSIADVLEVAEVTGDTVFRDVGGWCSLKAFGILVTLENDWGSPVEITSFAKLTTCRDLLRESFLSLAARVFAVGRETLSPDTAIGSIDAWDSVNHLRLVMEAEAKFGLHYDLERIPALKTLEDFIS